MEKLEIISQIENFSDDNPEGLFGFCIVGGQDENRSYTDIGETTLYMLSKYPEQIELLEEMLVAISGYNLEELLEKMNKEQDYYNGL